jgi:hypothetical protein
LIWTAYRKFNISINTLGLGETRECPLANQTISKGNTATGSRVPGKGERTREAIGEIEGGNGRALRKGREGFRHRYRATERRTTSVLKHYWPKGSSKEFEWKVYELERILKGAARDEARAKMKESLEKCKSDIKDL